jgi:16S rRNA (cytosine1407-C5)-methyltransferase
MNKASFDAWYSGLFGSRWGGLRAALLEERKAIPFLGDNPLELMPTPLIAQAAKAPLLKPYFMDYASVLAAMALTLPASGEILDACAAPGGKSLVIASQMGENCRLLANELSSERRRRLVNTLDGHLPTQTRSLVTVSGFDAAAAAGRPAQRGRFSAILLDAPCSSERHILANKSLLDKWTPSRPAGLAIRQWALLSSAFLMLAPGGSLVYATCALAPQENDGVAGRLLQKYAAAVRLDKAPFTEGEATEFGRIILPDACGGLGPMYVAVFSRAR